MGDGGSGRWDAETMRRKRGFSSRAQTNYFEEALASRITSPGKPSTLSTVCFVQHCICSEFNVVGEKAIPEFVCPEIGP